jgi:hypothetical protein
MAEVISAISHMKSRKASGIDEITPEMLKALDEAGLELIHEMLNKAWVEKVIPEEWSTAIIAPLYKNKGEKTKCQNYRGISLLSVVGKLYAIILERKLRAILGNKISKRQFGFQPRKGTRDCIFVLRQLIEKAILHKKELHLVFIDLEKAYDLVDRDKVWAALTRMGVGNDLLDALKSFYRVNKVAVRLNNQLSDHFYVRRGLRQGCPLSPLLFIATFNAICEKLAAERIGFPLGKDTFLNLIAFADDGTLVGMNHEEISSLLDIFNDACLELGLKINVAKTQYMVVNELENRDLFLNGIKLEKVKTFKYLGSIITDDGRMEEELKARMAKAGSCFGALVKIMCNRGHVSLDTKLIVLRCVLIPVLMYASETWNLTKAQESRLDVIEMRWLRSILGIKMMDFIPNCDIRLICGITEVSRLIERQRLKYLGHVIRMDEYEPDSLQNLMFFWEPPADWVRLRGRPRTRWVDGLKRSLYKVGLDNDWTLVDFAARDREGWQMIGNSKLRN